MKVIKMIFPKYLSLGVYELDVSMEDCFLLLFHIKNLSQNISYTFKPDI
jgi:hypothetical protein